MKAMCRVLTATAFLVPAFLISSCDDKNSNPVAPSDDPGITDIEAPSFTTVGFGSRWHDPHIKGAKVRTFLSEIGSACSESHNSVLQAKRFKSEDGAELSTLEPGDFSSDVATETHVLVYGREDECLAGVYPVEQKIKGKLLTAVKELDFSYSGGPLRGAPQLRIPIDECLLPEIIPNVIQYCSTDGTMERYAYIGATDEDEDTSCGDGDPFLGVVAGEDKEDCPVWYNDGEVDEEFPNWAAFVNDDRHVNWRVARKKFDPAQLPDEFLIDARTEVVISAVFDDRTSHYAIWMLDIR